MDRRFGRLIELQLEHSYFENQEVGSFFSIQPTYDTIQALRQNRLLYRATAGGFVVLHEGLETVPNTVTPLHSYDSDLKLSFTVHSRLESFTQITDLPLDGRPFYYFHNYQSNPTPGNDLLIYGNGQANPFVGPADQLYLQGERLQIFEETADETKTLRLLDQNGVELINETIATTELENGKRLLEYAKRLDQWGPGKYTLKLQGKADKAFYASNTLVGKAPLAYIELTAHTNAPSTYRYIDDDGLPVARKYKLKFNSRSTRWSYLFVPKGRKDLDAAKVKIEGDPSFTDKADITLANGERAIRIRSTNTFPLKEKSTVELSLKEAQGNARYIERLPIPPAEGLKRSPLDSPTIYSEVIVYI